MALPQRTINNELKKKKPIWCTGNHFDLYLCSATVFKFTDYPSYIYNGDLHNNPDLYNRAQDGKLAPSLSCHGWPCGHW